MSYRRILVVVCGNLHHGKDTLADALKELIPDSIRDAFAAPLKMCVHLKTGVPLEWLNDPTKKDDPKWGVYGQTLRKLMQDEGEEARQRISLTVWSDRAVDRHEQGQARVRIISDGRHPDQEIVAVKERVSKDTLVVAVRVKRPGYPIKRGHPSEDKIADAPDSSFDVNTLNDGTREEFIATKAQQLADYIYLWALTGKRLKAGWIVRCPNGARQRWAHAEKSDASVLAVAPGRSSNPCTDCGTNGAHKVEPANFDGLLTSG